jgi:O-methyltransferase/aklanonic acid methyltransferase
MIMKPARGVFDGVFDKVAGEYDTEGIIFFKPVAERLVEHVGVKPGQRVLDIGCGRGAVTFPLAAAVGAEGEVFGIDLSAGMIEAIPADVVATGIGNVKVRQMDGQDPTFAPRDFDAITGSMSIIMVPDLPTAFTNYLHLLKPGGTLAFTAPDTRNRVGAWKSGPVDIGRVAAEIPPSVLAEQPMLAKAGQGRPAEPVRHAQPARLGGFHRRHGALRGDRGGW